MPDIDGYKLLDIVKAFYRDYKVMVMTEDNEKKKWLLQRGLLKSFNKPMALETFLEELSMFIKERRKTKRFKVERQLLCAIRDIKSNTTYTAELVDVSIDGIIQAFRPDRADTQKRRENLPGGSVFRRFPGADGSGTVEALYRDQSRLIILPWLSPLADSVMLPIINASRYGPWE
jgi:hypothetical protein